MTTYTKARLVDNTPTTESCFAKAEALTQQIVATVRNRETYVQKNDLDPDFCLPAFQWDPTDLQNGFNAAFALIANDLRAQLPHLRFRCRMFTGYTTLLMGTIPKGADITAPVPADFDESVLSNDPGIMVCGLPLVERWERLIQDVPAKYRYCAPPVLGEVGWKWGEYTINSDVVGYQERLTLLHRAGIFDRLEKIKQPRILEIGGGYGALAHVITEALPAAAYYICDLPECLLFSGLYLTCAGDGSDRSVGLFPNDFAIQLVPNYQAQLIPGNFDLVINTLSLTEMSPPQQHVYGNLIKQWIGNDGLFFEQNQGIKPWRYIFNNNQKLSLGDIEIRQGVVELWWN